MSNLFSTFDPHTIMYFMRKWLPIFAILFILPSWFWITDSQMTKSFDLIIKLLMMELEAIFSGLMIPGASIIF